MQTHFIKAFPTLFMLCKDVLSVQDTFNLKKILFDIEKDKDLTPPSNWKCEARTSYNHKNSELDDYISNKFEKQITDYLDQEHSLLPDPCNLNIESWHNLYASGEFQEAHDHLAPLVVACGIYLLEQNPNSTSKLMFLDPNKELKNASGIRDIVEIPNIDANDLILFPPYMRHLVSKENASVDRISVSFNITIKN